MDLQTIETPDLILDSQVMKRNIKRLKDKLKQHGVGFRPHVKTNKSAEVSRNFGDPLTTPITVSTLKEARYFFENGWRDILYGVGIVPSKFDIVGDLIRKGAKMTVILDNVETAEALSAYCEQSGLLVNVLIEIDTDGHRSGVKPEDGLLLEIAAKLSGQELPGKAFLAGVMTHAGESYFCKTRDDIVAMAERERSGVVRAAKRLREAGCPAPVVSVGSTPTAHFADSLAGVTEVRAGVFIFFDLFMHGVGVCKLDDIALSVLCTVIGHQKEKGWVITDSGWMAMSRDRGTQNQAVDQFYGVVCDVHGKPIPGLVMKGANQEHGIIVHRDDPTLTPELPIGTRLRILPNHACATGAQFGHYTVIAEDGSITGQWPRINGWHHRVSF